MQRLVAAGGRIEVDNIWGQMSEERSCPHQLPAYLAGMLSSLLDMSFIKLQI